MAQSALAILKEDRNKSILNKNSGSNSYENTAVPTVEPNTDYNTNGFIGGVGYALERAGLGFLQSVEGIWDYAAGGIADLFGADDWAKKQFDNDWANYNHADEWYNPSEGWKFAGDVASGIGNSAPSMLAVAGAAAITYFSGGTLSPVAAGLIAATVAGTGAAGMSTKEAYRETGELTGKEYGYGALSGATEAGLEFLTMGMGAGSGRIIANIANRTARESAQTIAKTVAKETFVRTIVKDFAAEAFEEGTAEILSPHYKRMTYDPNAKNATLQEVLYVSAVGGFSGAIMGGTSTTINNANNLVSGNNVVNKNLTASVMEMGRQIAETETTNNTGYAAFETVKNVYNQLTESLATTGGEIKTVKQKMLLGELNRANTTAVMMPYIERSAEKILANPEQAAQRISTYLTDTTGNKVSITAADLMEGIDTSSRQAFVKSLRKALTSNSKLTTIAVADATGHLMMDTKAFEEATLRGENLATVDDYNRFIENANENQLKSVGDTLGISDWSNMTYEGFQAKMGEFANSGKLAEAAEQTRRIKEASNIPESQAKRRLDLALAIQKDGTNRFITSNVDIAVTKKGDKYYIYDFVDKKISRALSKTELQSAINEIKAHNQSFAEAMNKRSRMTNEAKEIDAYCRENIGDYKKLNANNQAMIRKLIREGRKTTLSEADLLSCARVSAHSGIKVEINKQALLVGKDKETQKDIYADGVYDIAENRILVNPESTRAIDSLLLHELTHAIYKTKDGKLILIKGVKNMSENEKISIMKKYSESGHGSTIELIDELNAHYVEGQLSNKNILKKLIEDKPSIKEKILDFFKGATNDYKTDEKLSKQAKRLYKQYKKLFDEFSNVNQQNLSVESSVANMDTKVENDSVRHALYEFNDGQRFVIVETDQNLFDGLTVKEQTDLATKIIKNRFQGKVIGIDNKAFVNGVTANEYTHPSKHIEPDIYVAKMHASTELDNLMDAGFGFRNAADGSYGHTHAGAVGGFDYFDVIFKVANEYFQGVINIENNKRGKRLKDITKIENITKDMVSRYGNNPSYTFLRDVSMISIHENGEKVNTNSEKRNALPKTDSKGNTLSTEQKEFFKDSKVRDENGNLLVVYHGTNSKFTVFDYNKTKLGKLGYGFYFTANKNFAKNYAVNDNLVEAYIKVTNPLVIEETVLTEEQIDKMLENLSEFELDAENKTIQELKAEILTQKSNISKNFAFLKIASKYQDILDNMGNVIGFDGIVAKNWDEYVVFEPNQVKSTTNKKPTSNPDIRFALPQGNYRYALNIDGSNSVGTAETTKNLVALHNLSEDKLLSVIRLGGFPMPSIAITKADIEHSNFGDITVVFGKDTIDPSKKANKVYGKDAWTPTFPRIDALLEGVEEEAEQDMERVSEYNKYKLDISNFYGQLQGYTGETILENNDTEKFKRYAKSHYNGVLATYLREIGEKDIAPVTEELTMTDYKIPVEYIRSFANKKGYTLEQLYKDRSLSSEEFVSKYKDSVIELLVEFTASKGKVSIHDAKEIFSDIDFRNIDMVFYSFIQAMKTNETTTVDERATREKLLSKIDESKFDKWLDEKFLSLTKTVGIRNNKDVFAPNGTRRKFNALHTEYTLENIVKAMKSEADQTGQAGWLGATVGSISAKLARQFRSIKDIKEASELLNTDDAAYTEAKSKASDLLSELVDDMRKGSELFRSTEREIIAEIADKNPKSPEEIYVHLSKESEWVKVSEDIAEKMHIFFETLRHLPTDYFEAKPQRAVGLDEIKMVLIPQSASQKLRNYLKNANVPFQEYDKTEGRTEAIKKLDNVRFALPYRSRTADSVTTEIEQVYKPTIKDTLFTGWTSVQIALTNEQAGVEKVGRILGIKNIDAMVQAARASRNQAEEMIGGNQYRIGADTKNYQGEGLEKILRPIKEHGAEYTEVFFDYLFNYHNVNRMSLEKISIQRNNGKAALINKNKANIAALTKQIKSLEKRRAKAPIAQKKSFTLQITDLKNQIKSKEKANKKLQQEVDAFVPAKNKPVLDATAQESAKAVKEYEKNYSDFKGVAQKLWKFLENLNQYRVDTGLISQDTMLYLKSLYSHYVPTYRTDATKGIGAINGKYNLQVKSTVKTAKGSTKDLMPPDVMIARQVMETVRAGRINQLANALYEGALSSGKSTYIEIVSKEKVNDADVIDLDPTELRPKNNEITFFRDGEKIVMRVSKEVFAGFDAFNPKVEIANPLTQFANKINKTFKRLVTSLNPAFLVRNSARDIQDAGIYSKYPKAFMKNYAKAAMEIKNDGQLWQLYKAMGGFNSSVFDFDKGYSGSQNKWGLTKAEGNILKKTLITVENANAFVEQLPRLAEFLSSIEAGNTAEQAILDSADVTTNFGRSGSLVKKLNSTLIPFLNPSVQGFSKLIRTLTGARTAKEISILVFKIAVVGIIPHLINDLMYDDDEDYEQLRDTDKENNFLFKVGDKFIKIPKGRVASVFAGAVNRTKDMFDGESDAWDGYLKNVMQQVTPVESFSRTIFSPFSDVKNNLTWYGSAIEGQQFENTAPKDRYDESTSSIAVLMGKVLNYSPKKIHYLLDQYSGVIGDFILPATTKKAEKDFLSGNFTLDPVTSNKLSTDFYDIYEQAQYAKTAGDDTAIYQVKYLNKVKSAINEMYKQKSEIQNSSLTDKEKIVETEAVQMLINEAFKTAINDYELWTQTVESTQNIGLELDEDARINMRYTEATRLMYGAERALREYDDKVYAKCQSLNLANIGYDNLYYFYFASKDIESDKDNEGNTVPGSKRAKTLELINSMKLTKEQKLLLLCYKGYSIKDGDIKGISAENAKKKLAKYILSLKISKAQKEELAELCGFEIKNGRILASSLK